MHFSVYSIRLIEYNDQCNDSQVNVNSKNKSDVIYRVSITPFTCPFLVKPHPCLFILLLS